MPVEMSTEQWERGMKACRVALGWAQMWQSESTAGYEAGWREAVGEVRKLAASTPNPDTTIRVWWRSIGPSGPWRAEDGWHHRFEQVFSEPY